MSSPDHNAGVVDPVDGSTKAHSLEVDHTEKESGLKAGSTGSADGSDAEKTGNTANPATADENPLAAPADNPNARPACFNSTIVECLFVITVTMAIAMGSFVLGGTIVISDYIGEDLNMTNAEITWIQASISLGSGAFLLPFGKVADLFGRKPLFIFSLFAFSALAPGAGFCQSGIALDAVLGVLGLMTAAAVPAAVGSLGTVYQRPSQRKNWAFACFSAGNPLGFVFGTLYSGIATQLFNWRASFYFLAMIYIVITVVAIFTVPAQEAPNKITWAAIKNFDFIGTILVIAGIGMLSTALTNGSNADQGWRTPYVIALLVVGVVLLGVYIWWETVFPEPLMPMGIWRDRDFSLLNLVQGLTFGSFNSAMFWITLFFQRIWAHQPILVAVYTLPMAIMGIIVNIVVGLILHRVSNKILSYVACSAYMVCFILLAVNKATFSYWAVCFTAFLFGVWGADTLFNVSNMYIMSSMQQSQQSVAGGIAQCVIRLSATIILGITTAIFSAVEQDPPKTGYYAGDTSAPYASAIWFSVGLTGISFIALPFLRIGTQGH